MCTHIEMIHQCRCGPDDRKWLHGRPGISCAHQEIIEPIKFELSMIGVGKGFRGFLYLNGASWRLLWCDEISECSAVTLISSMANRLQYWRPSWCHVWITPKCSQKLIPGLEIDKFFAKHVRIEIAAPFVHTHMSPVTSHVAGGGGGLMNEEFYKTSFIFSVDGLLFLFIFFQLVKFLCW